MKKIRFFYEGLFHFFMKTAKISRIAVFMLLASFFQTFANDTYPPLTSFSLDFSTTRLINTLDDIEDISEFHLLLNEKLIDTDRELSMRIDNQKTDEMLHSPFAGTDLVSTIDDGKITLVAFLSDIQQRQKTITGTVTDESGEPLSGVTVLIKGTGNGTVTNIDGHYSISNIPENAILVFSFVGMLTQEVEVGNNLTIDITMQVDAIGFEEVVAIGYGTRFKRDLTGSVGSVGHSAITERPTSTNILQGLAGKVAGVTVMTNSGAPGGSSTVIKIRGVGSLNSSNKPLFVVDGIVDVDPNTIDPNIIESVDILKDAGSASIYGSKGANGVVVITTLKYDKNTSNISFNNSISLGRLQNEISVLDANGALEMFKRQYEYVPGRLAPHLDPNNNFPRKDDLFNPDGSPIYNTDWQKEATRLAVSHNHSLTLSKKVDDFTAITNLSIHNDQGIILNSYAKQLNGFVKINWNAKSWLNIQSSIYIGGKQSENNLAASGAVGNDYRPIYYTLPFLPVKYADGSYSRNSDYPGADPTSENPIRILENIKNIMGKTYARGNFIANFHLTDNLDFTSTFSGQTTSDYLFSYSGAGLRNISEIQNGVATRTNLISGAWTNEDYFTYKNTFGKSQVNIVAGASWYYNVSTSTFAGSQDYFDDVFTFNSLQAGSNTITPASNRSANQFNSYFGRLHYAYDDRYIIDASYRIDGSSRFGTNNKYGQFPSISGAWNISKESFFEGVNRAINNLKLRISYGFVGNAEIGDYVTMARLNNSVSVFNSSLFSAVTLASVQNNDLSWEKSSQLNLGLDADFFNSRVQLSLDIYDRITRDLLYNKSIPMTTGYTTAIDNIGSIQNRGIELNLQTVNISQPDFTWNTSINYSLNRNKVLELNGDILYGIYGTTRIMEDRPLNEFYGYVRLGVWGTDETAEAAEYGMKPGDIKYDDLDDNGIIDSKDQTDIGNGMPKYEINMMNTFAYKNLSLYLDLGSMIGLHLLNFLDPFMLRAHSQTNAFQNILDDSWTPDNQQVMIPQLRRASDPRPYPLSQGDSYFVENGTFLRVRNIALAYRLDAELLGIKQIKDFSVGVNIENALLFTKYKGSDPESSSLGGYFYQGWDNGQYPKPRTFSLSLKVNF